MLHVEDLGQLNNRTFFPPRSSAPKMARRCSRYTDAEVDSYQLEQLRSCTPTFYSDNSRTTYTTNYIQDPVTASASSIS